MALIAFVSGASSSFLGLTFLRIAFGLTMVTHGLPKLLGRSHGTMLDPMASSTRLIENGLGLPFAAEIAMAVALLEGVGGLLIAVGVASRLFALAFAAEMIGISIVLGPTWPWIDRGIEYPVMLFFVALAIATTAKGWWPLNTVAQRIRGASGKSA